MTSSRTQTTTILSKLLIGLCVFGVVAMSAMPLLVHAQPTPRSAVPEEQNERAENNDPDDSSLFQIGGVEGFIYTVATGFGGVILGIAGNLLEYAIAETVVGMGDYLRGGLGVAIDKMWTVIRDFFNIVFIFGLIYIGFRTILKSDDAGTKSAVALLIVAALLINFSLFITKAIVDFSNLMAFQIHQVIISDDTNAGVRGTNTGNLGTGSGSVRIQQVDEGSISGTFMDYFRLTTYAQTDVLEELRSETYFHGGRLLFYGLLMMMIMLIAAFVFAAGAFMLIARFVALTIFMILSPVMFLGFIFPLFQQYQTKWWNGFLKHAFIAPAYLFMLYLSLWALAGIGFSGSFAQAFSAEAWQQGFFIIFLNFFIIAGFLIASLLLAREFGIQGAAASVNMLNRAKDKTISYGKRAAGGATFGLAARGGRTVVGQAAHRAAESETFKDIAERSAFGRSLWRGTRRVADSSFDVRKIGGIGKEMGIGEGRKGGYSTITKERAKRDLKEAEDLGTTDMSTREAQAEVEAKISEQTEAVKNAKEKVDGLEQQLRERERELRETTRPYRERIRQLNEEYKTATDERRKEITQEISDTNDAIAAARDNFNEENAPLKNEIESARGELQTAEQNEKKARGLASAEVEYKRQIALMDQLERNANRFSSFFGTSGSAAAGAGGGGVAAFLAPVGLAAGAAATGGGALVGGAAAQSYAHRQKSSLNALKKRWGRHGEKGPQWRQEKETLTAISERAKETGLWQSEGGGAGGTSGGSDEESS